MRPSSRHFVGTSASDGLAALADIEEAQRAQGATPPHDDELMDQAVTEVRAYGLNTGALPVVLRVVSTRFW